MALIVSPAPDAAVDAVARQLQTMVDKGALLLPTVDTADPTSFSVSFWHPALEPDPDVDIGGSDVMKSLIPAGHRLILNAGDDQAPVALLEVVSDDGNHRLAGLSNGPIFDALVSAIASAEQRVDADAISYEPVLIELDILRSAALWLQTDRSTDELFLPLTVTPTAQRIGFAGILRRDEFLDRLDTLLAVAGPEPLEERPQPDSGARV
jgi:hypothetical protein